MVCAGRWKFEAGTVAERKRGRAKIFIERDPIVSYVGARLKDAFSSPGKIERSCEYKLWQAKTKIVADRQQLEVKPAGGFEGAV